MSLEPPQAAPRGVVLKCLTLLRAGLRPLLGDRRARELIGYGYAVGTLLTYSFQEQHRRALLGLLWLIVTPVLFLAVYLQLFSGMVDPSASASLGGKYGYSMYVVFGFLTWSAFVEGVQGGAAALVSNPGLVQHSPIPLSVLPFVKVLSGLTGLMISCGILLVLQVGLGRFPGARLLLFPLALALLGAFTLGLALLLSAVATAFRDVLQVLSTILLVEFFAVPILYTPAMLSPVSRSIVELNPLTPFFYLVRASFMREHPIEPTHIALAVAWSLLSLVVGRAVFRRLSSGFGDAS